VNRPVGDASADPLAWQRARDVHTQDLVASGYIDQSHACVIEADDLGLESITSEGALYHWRAAV
jgi:hypothetical protein